MNLYDARSDREDSDDSPYNARLVYEDNGDANTDTVRTTQSFVNPADREKPLKGLELKQLAEDMGIMISNFTDAMRHYNPASANTTRLVYLITLSGKSTINGAIDLCKGAESVKNLWEQDSKDARQAIELSQQVLKACSPTDNSTIGGDTTESNQLETRGPGHLELRQNLGLPDGFKLPEDLKLYHLRQDMNHALTAFRAEMTTEPPPDSLAYMIQYIDGHALRTVSLAIKMYYEACNAAQDCEQNKKDARRLMGLAMNALRDIEG